MGLFSHSDQQRAAQTLTCQYASNPNKGAGGRLADALAAGRTSPLWVPTGSSIAEIDNNIIIYNIDSLSGVPFSKSTSFLESSREQALPFLLDGGQVWAGMGLLIFVTISQDGCPQHTCDQAGKCQDTAVCAGQSQRLALARPGQSC